MGNFLKYESSNFRTFKIELNAVIEEGEPVYTGKMIRPKKRITKDDLLGAIISMHQVSEAANGTVTTSDFDIIMTSVGSIEISQLNTETLFVHGGINLGQTSASIEILYDVSSDAFNLTMLSNAAGGVAAQVDLENVFVDEFGRVEEE